MPRFRVLLRCTVHFLCLMRPRPNVSQCNALWHYGNAKGSLKRDSFSCESFLSLYFCVTRRNVADVETHGFIARKDTLRDVNRDKAGTLPVLCMARVCTHDTSTHCHQYDSHPLSKVQTHGRRLSPTKNFHSIVLTSASYSVDWVFFRVKHASLLFEQDTRNARSASFNRLPKEVSTRGDEEETRRRRRGEKMKLFHFLPEKLTGTNSPNGKDKKKVVQPKNDVGETPYDAFCGSFPFFRSFFRVV